MINIVLDTNCLISSFSKRGNYFNVWRGLHSGKYILYVSNEILEEYEDKCFDSIQCNTGIAKFSLCVIIFFYKKLFNGYVEKIRL